MLANVSDGILSVKELQLEAWLVALFLKEKHKHHISLLTFQT